MVNTMQPKNNITRQNTAIALESSFSFTGGFSLRLGLPASNELSRFTSLRTGT
jgi:hypothetical protein